MEGGSTIISREDSMKQPKDIRNRTLYVGAKVAWPGRYGSTLRVSAGEIVKMDKYKTLGYDFNEQDAWFVWVRITHTQEWDRDRIGDTVKLTRIDNIVVVG
jgi:hypothetical protein